MKETLALYVLTKLLYPWQFLFSGQGTFAIESLIDSFPLTVEDEMPRREWNQDEWKCQSKTELTTL